VSPAGSSDLITTYNHEIEQMDGSKSTISLNEATCALGASSGNRNPTEAGIRLNGIKHMINYHDAEAKCCKLTSSAGGASVAQTGTAIVVGFWRKDQVMSNGKP
jgi:hypothetical protein